MLGEFLARLAVALPLVCGLAVLTLVAAKRGWVRLPQLSGRRLTSRGSEPDAAVAAPELTVTSSKALSPAARVAVIRFDGRDHLLGVTAQQVVLLATAPSRAAAARGTAEVKPAAGPDRQEPHT